MLDWRSKYTILPEMVEENDENWDELILKPSLKSSLSSQIIEPIQDDKSPKDYSSILFGPPGTGKTTIPFAMANELKWDLFYINPRHFFKQGFSVELAISECFEDIKKYVESKTKNQTPMKAKCIFVFDEIDELVTERNDGADRQSRMVTTMMLPLFNDLRKYAKKYEFLFFVLTNHIQRFDPAIKRKGRFDLILPVGPPPRYARFLLLQKIVDDRIKECDKQGIILSNSDLDFNILSLSAARLGYGDIKNVCNRAIDQMLHLEAYSISEFVKRKKKTPSTPDYVLPYPLNTSTFLSWFNRQRNSTKDIQGEIDRFFQEYAAYTRSASPSTELGQVQEKAEDEFEALIVQDYVHETSWNVNQDNSLNFNFRNLTELNNFDGKIDVILNGAGFDNETILTLNVLVDAGGFDGPDFPIIINPKSKGNLHISYHISGHFVLRGVVSTYDDLSYLKGEKRFGKNIEVV